MCRPHAGKTAYDAIVVGSGATGGIAAKLLTEGGLRVALLEAGDAPSLVELQHISETRLSTYTKPPVVTQAERPIQSECYACRNDLANWFVDDVAQPYESSPSYSWIRIRALAGRLLAWEGQSYRLSDLDFRAASLDGQGSDWPITYAELSPYYDVLERYLQVAGKNESLPQLPDGQFTAPAGRNLSVELLRVPLWDRYKRTVTPSRLATMTCRKHDKQAKELLSQESSSNPGFHTPWRALYDAAFTGRLDLFTGAVVHKLVPRCSKGNGVSYVDKASKEIRDIYGRFIFLCASTLESTRILLSSNVGDSSGLLGTGLMDHLVGAGASGYIELSNNGLDDGGFQRHRAYIPRFRNLTSRERLGFLRGYGYQLRTLLPADPDRSHTGRTMAKVILSSFGETLRDKHNRVALSDTQVDEFGIPALKIHAVRTPNEAAMAHDAAVQAAEMLTACSFRDVRMNSDCLKPGLSVHELGTAPMGWDPRTSVVDSHCQLHDAKDIFVTDGACWTSSGCQNPTLTMMALTARTCRYVLKHAQSLSPRG